MNEGDTWEFIGFADVEQFWGMTEPKMWPWE